jgi:hypothetical protein
MGQQCPDRSSGSLKKGALLMSKTISYNYLPPETNLRARLRATIEEHKQAASVVVHWGIQSRQDKLEALLADQEANLHSLMFDNTCSCGLVLTDEGMTTILDLVLSKHHRNHKTLELETSPRFRGLVGRRLFGMGRRNRTDENWDKFVLSYVSRDLGDGLAVPEIWTVRDSTIATQDN